MSTDKTWRLHFSCIYEKPLARCAISFFLWASEPGSVQEVPSLLWWHCALCSTFIGMDGKVGVGYDFFGCVLWGFFFF